MNLLQLLISFLGGKTKLLDFYFLLAILSYELYIVIYTNKCISAYVNNKKGKFYYFTVIGSNVN